MTERSGMTGDWEERNKQGDRAGDKVGYIGGVTSEGGSVKGSGPNDTDRTGAGTTDIGVSDPYDTGIAHTGREQDGVGVVNETEMIDINPQTGQVVMDPTRDM